jgi:hypothetical protein
MFILPEDGSELLPTPPVSYEEISAAAQPLMDYLCENSDAFPLAIVTPTHVDIVSGTEMIHVPSKIKEE